MRHSQNDLFHFSRKEKNGIIFILLLNLLIFFLPDIIQWFTRHQENAIFVEQLHLEKKFDSLSGKQTVTNDSFSESLRPVDKTKPVDYFDFDPNSCSSADWIKMGVKEKTAATILKYISKGGKFRSPDDLRKIWGLHEEQLKAIMPHVKIRNTTFQKNPKYDQPVYVNRQFNKMIDINTADSAEWEKLPGIGPALSSRIIKYRNKLGGFFETGQLQEVWGLTDTVLEKIQNRLQISGQPEKIDINSADFLLLKSHPYIGYKSANAIINYRKQHGKFDSLEDIQKIIVINEKTFSKLLHYLMVK